MTQRQDGDFEELVAEGRIIERRLHRTQIRGNDSETEAENFPKMMRSEKVKQTMRPLKDKPIVIISMNSSTRNSSSLPNKLPRPAIFMKMKSCLAQNNI